MVGYWCIRFAVVLIFAIGAGFYRAATGGEASQLIASLSKDTPISWIGGAIATLVYYTVAEGVGGATLGKRLVGLQVSDVSLDRCTVKQAFKRSLAFFYDGLFFGLVANRYMSESHLKQRAGDQWAGTVVVKRGSVSRHEPTSLFFVGLFASSVAQAEVFALTRLVEYAWLSSSIS